MKVCSRGKMFDLGGGKQFGNIEDLIEHYKEHPFKVTDGRQVYLLQVHIGRYMSIHKLNCRIKVLLCVVFCICTEVWL